VTGVALTAEQQRAAERREDGLLVAAGAGSGKTSVLVERFTRAVVADGVAIGAILAITFTEKAAAELKGRVRDRLIAEGRHVEARAAEGAFISTIHGFCSRLLRTHALAAGIDPEYRVLDALEAERLGVEAFDGALSAFLHADADPERLRLVAAYTPDRLAAMVRTAYAHLRSRGAIMPELPEIEPPRPGDQRERLERAAGAALGEIAALDGVVVGRARARIERCVELLERSPDVAELDAAALGKLGVGTGANALKTPAFDAYREALDALTALVSHQQEYRDQGLLRDLLHSYGDRYATLKRDRSALDFDDLELQANELLRTDPLVRERWAERFEHVMIDEFQDTSPLQNELLERIAGERLFRVGDEFQSIYRFRHADVAVFREQADRARAQDRFESLTANFRSRPEVLDAINVLFGAVWGERFPRLRAGSPGGVQAPDRPSVELIVADRPHNGSRWRERFAAAEGGPELAFGETLRDVTPARAAEARILAKRIDELLGEGRCTAGDVVLLVRATTHLAAYERALEDRGIPTYVMGGRGYWSQQQVGDLRAYLAALANPLDELALYTALASPLAGVSVDGLIVLRAAARTSRRDPWTVLRDLVAGGAQAQNVATELGTADAERARRFAALLGEERDRAPRLSIETVIDRAVTRSGYDLHVLAASAGRRRMANVRKLMRLAREFEAEEGRDLRAFIDYVAERDELGDRQGEAPLEPEDVHAVRLMTVHRAKGLEFPVVCVADLGKPGREDRSALQISDDGNVGISLAQLGGGSVASTRLAAIRERQKLADEEEEKRVFYVAATRAEELLILSGATDLEKLPEEQPLEEPLRWIWRALAPELPEIESEATVERSIDGRAVPIRCLVLRPDTVDELLTPADRAPRRADAPPPGLEALDVPALAAVPPPRALAVSRLSYTGLQRYAECGYRFYLERSLRLPRPDALAPVDVVAPEPLDALPAIVRGAVAHQLLERLDHMSPAAPAPEAVARAIAAHGEVVRDDEVAEIARLVAGFAGTPIQRRIAAAERVRAELAFAFTLAPPGGGRHPLLVNGVVDVHATEPDRVLIVDYKSDRLGDRDPDELVSGDYATLRLVYALAALRSGAERVEVAYVLLERPDDPVTAVYERSDVPPLEDRLRELAAGVTEGRFAPTDRPWRGLCGDCPGQPGLCSWEPERTLAPEPA
jgi:ATP-dependent exoDNAse (exonuclease V) beta subunit